jgi:membrane glycosyltransferase
MNGNDKRGKFVELAGSVALEDVLRIKVRRRRWAVALITLGISFLGLWLMIDVVRAGGWTPLKVVEVGLFCLLFASLSFGFTQAFLGFLVLVEGREPLKITNTLRNDTPWHPRR